MKPRTAGAHDLTPIIDRARDLDRAILGASHLARHPDITPALDGAANLARELARDLDRDGPDPARDLARAGVLDRGLSRARARAIDLDLDRGRDLDSAVDLARGLSHALLDAKAASRDAVSSRAAVTICCPSRCAGQLAGFAARVLPAAQRPRYREEFRAELHELARLRWWRQLAYAMHLLVRARELRHEVGGAQRFPTRKG